VLRDAPAFALLHRSNGVEVLLGAPLAVRDIAGLPCGDTHAGPDVVAVLPYRQIAARGLPCVDDGAPLLAFAVQERHRLPTDDALRWLAPPAPRADAGFGFDVVEHGFDVSDAEYEAIVRRVVEGDIGRGTGSNFVIRRTFRATVDGFTRRTALAVFGRL